MSGIERQELVAALVPGARVIKLTIGFGGHLQGLFDAANLITAISKEPVAPLRIGEHDRDKGVIGNLPCSLQSPEVPDSDVSIPAQ